MIYTHKLSKSALTTAAEFNKMSIQYVVVNVVQCSLLHGYMLYLHNDILVRYMLSPVRLSSVVGNARAPYSGG